VITVIVAISAEFLVSAIEHVIEQWHISETFVGLILLPIVGNAAEHVTAVTVAYKNKVYNVIA
jgi:Ca2+:H+ antiporter